MLIPIWDDDLNANSDLRFLSCWLLIGFCPKDRSRVDQCLKLNILRD